MSICFQRALIPHWSVDLCCWSVGIDRGYCYGKHHKTVDLRKQCEGVGFVLVYHVLLHGVGFKFRLLATRACIPNEITYDSYENGYLEMIDMGLLHYKTISEGITESL